jgi:hypothetical protein
VLAVRLEQVRAEPDARADLVERLEGRAAGDVQVVGEGSQRRSSQAQQQLLPPAFGPLHLVEGEQVPPGHPGVGVIDQVAEPVISSSGV